MLELNEIALADFRRLTFEEVNELLPVWITFNGKPVFIISKIEETVLLHGMHPTALRRFKLQEAKIRHAQGVELTKIYGKRKLTIEQQEKAVVVDEDGKVGCTKKLEV